jgi:hypothetical protein
MLSTKVTKIRRKLGWNKKDRVFEDLFDLIVLYYVYFGILKTLKSSSSKTQFIASIVETRPATLQTVRQGCVIRKGNENRYG